MLDPTRTDNRTDGLTASLYPVHNNCPGTSSSPRYTNIYKLLGPRRDWTSPGLVLSCHCYEAKIWPNF